MSAWLMAIYMCGYCSVLWYPGEQERFLLVHHEVLTMRNLRHSNNIENLIHPKSTSFCQTNHMNNRSRHPCSSQEDREEEKGHGNGKPEFQEMSPWWHFQYLHETRLLFSSPLCQWWSLVSVRKSWLQSIVVKKCNLSDKFTTSINLLGYAYMKSEQIRVKLFPILFVFKCYVSIISVRQRCQTGSGEGDGPRERRNNRALQTKCWEGMGRGDTGVRERKGRTGTN